ncbi:MAG: NAD(P)H-dependent oxidoreductase [Arenicellales bacterium]
MSLKLVVLYGSVRSARQGIKAAKFVVGACRDRGHEVTLIDPLEYPLPLIDKMYKEYGPGEAPPTLERIAKIVIAADAYIVVSGEYNHTVPPALSNLLDHFLEEYFWKPSAIVCYSGGSFGGVRAAMTLRAMLAELGMSSIPSLLPIPKVQNAFDEDGTPKDPVYDKRAAEFLEELEWYGNAMRAARQTPCHRSECAAAELVASGTASGG